MPPIVYFFMHIQKTAGKALAAHAKAQYGNKQVSLYRRTLADEIATLLDERGLEPTSREVVRRWIAEYEVPKQYVHQHMSPHDKCVFGHCVYYGLHEAASFPMDARYITFLREPVARTVSLFYHLKNASDQESYWAKEIHDNEWSIAEWVQYTKELRATNGQVRHLLMGQFPEVEYERELTVDHLEAAKKTLDKFWYVGFQETFDDDLMYLLGALHFTRCGENRRYNTAKEKHALTSRDNQIIRHHNMLDIQLYEHAVAQKQQWMELNKRKYYSYQKRGRRLISTLGPIVRLMSRTKRVIAKVVN